MTPDGYVPLEGRLRGPLYSVRLYVGENHLLKTTVAGVHEYYKRYAWEDIQAFSLRLTPWGAAVNILCGFLLLLMAMAGVANRPGLAALVFGYLPPAAVLLAVLFYNIRRGPTCMVRIRTAVSDDWLGSLHRVKVARQELEKLKAIILARQAAVREGASEAGTPAAGTSAPAGLPQEPAPKPRDGGGWHRAGFATLAAGLVTDILYLTVPGLKKAIETGGIALLLAGLIVCIGMLIAQSRRATSPGLRTFGWLNFWYHVVSFLFLVAVFFAAMVREIQKAAAPGAEVPWDWDAIVRPATAVDAVLLIPLLAYGGYALFRHRGFAPPPPASAGA